MFWGDTLNLNRKLLISKTRKNGVRSPLKFQPNPYLGMQPGWPGKGGKADFYTPPNPDFRICGGEKASVHHHWDKVPPQSCKE